MTKQQPRPTYSANYQQLSQKLMAQRSVAIEAGSAHKHDCDDYDHFFQATSKTGGVGRMTDTSKYTGSHKERFDDSGKGKGKEGRAEIAKNDGYVGAYKGKGSYDKK